MSVKRGEYGTLTLLTVLEEGLKHSDFRCKQILFALNKMEILIEKLNLFSSYK